MLPWERRPIEIANLFNPAFCSLLIQYSVRGFERESGRGMPYTLALLVAYTNSPLAITEAEETRGAIVITHLPTGKRLGPAIDLSAISDLTQLLDQLAALPWDDDSLTPNDLRWDAVNIISDWQRE